MDTITKRDLVTKVSNQIGHSQSDVLATLECLLETITGELAQGNAVVMRNFGSFQVREMKGKVGRNPKKPDEVVTIPNRAVVKFKPGKEMKERVAPVLPLIQEG